MKVKEIKTRQAEMIGSMNLPASAEEGVCLWLSEIALQLGQRNQLASRTRRSRARVVSPGRGPRPTNVSRRAQ